MQYKAPETFKPETDFSNDKPMDVNSFSMLTWEVFTGEVPWARISDQQVMVKHMYAHAGTRAVERPERRDGDWRATTPDAVVALVEMCWAQAPEDRPSLSDVLAALAGRSVPSIVDEN